MSKPAVVLVTGSTGKQGRAVVDALLASPTPEAYHILAVTRSASSSAARALAQLPRTTVVEGSFDDPAKLFRAAGRKVDSAFLVTIVGDHALEEKQGKAFVDAALDHGVGHLVFTSVSRHGEGETVVPHFASKARIEAHLKEKAGDKMGWTILRPVAFMENFDGTTIGKVFGAMWWSTLRNDRPLQLVSTKDIGVVASLALRDPAKFNHRALELSGDELTFAQADAAFRAAIGTPAPQTFSFLGWVAKKAIGDMGIMFNWFKTDGFGADVSAARAVHPGMLSLQSWIAQESAYKRK